MLRGFFNLLLLHQLHLSTIQGYDLRDIRTTQEWLTGFSPQTIKNDGQNNGCNTSEKLSHQIRCLGTSRQRVGLNFYFARKPWMGNAQHGDSKILRTTLGLIMTGDFAAAWLPVLFVPMIGIVFPAVFIILVGRVITASD
jgi:photosystem I subunit 8